MVGVLGRADLKSTKTDGGAKPVMAEDVSNAASQVTSMAVVVATGITADVARKMLGLDVGDSEDEVLWRGFLTGLKKRDLAGVQLVISDQHAGLVAALKRSFQGAGTPALPSPLRRNLLAHFPKSYSDMVAVVLHTIFRPTRPPAPSPRPGSRSVTSSRAGSPRSAR